MKAIIICPDNPSAIPFLSRARPAALIPALGATLLSHALTMLAEAGAKDVTILAADRPEQIRLAVGGGERWGLSARVVAENRELSVAEARQKYRPDNAADWLPEGGDVLVADWPVVVGGASPLADGKSWFESLLHRLPLAHQHRVGVREIAPGVWVSLRARIEEGAVLQGPCWLGEGTWIRARARIGPNALIEDEALVDHDAEVTESWIGPRTYVGALTRVFHSLAWGRALLNYETKSFIEVPDAFLLSDLKPGRSPRGCSSLPGRFVALMIGLLTSPVVLAAWWRSRRKNLSCYAKQRAVTPFGGGGFSSMQEVEYGEFPGFSGLWKRWPQLLNIVRGNFAWVGNRPISRGQAAELTSEFEQLWLAAPIGLVSLADVEGCAASFDDEARAHASFYAAQAGRQLDRRILGRAFRHGLASIFSHHCQP